MPSLRLSFALAVLMAVTAVAPPSSYHARLRKSSPAANDTVAAPAQLQLWFSEKPVLAFTKVTLKNPAGVAQPLGASSFSDASDSAAVVYPVAAPLAPGRYTVNWSAAGDDGHPMKGKFEFSVR